MSKMNHPDGQHCNCGCFERYAISLLPAAEKAIFVGMMKGKVAKEIASERGTSAKTIYAQKGNLMRRFNLATHHDLILFGVRAGFISR